MVFGLFDPDVGTENLVVVAESESPEGPAWATIRKNIKRELLTALNIAPHVIQIVKPGWLIKSTSGKIGRGENLKKYLEGKASV